MTFTDSSPSNSVKFRFKNVGPIKEAEMELGDLTVIAGHNNTGKTYLAYTLYGFLKTWKSGWLDAQRLLGGSKAIQHDSAWQPLTIERVAKEALEEGRAKHAIDRNTLNRERAAVIQAVASEFSESELDVVFNSPRSTFAEASFSIELSSVYPRDQETLRATAFTGESFELHYDGRHIVMTSNWVGGQRPGNYPVPRFFTYVSSFRKFLFPELSLEPFLLCAERFGISLFYKELDFTKSRLVDLLQQMGDERDRERFSPLSFIEQATSRYALPIKDNIDYTRDIGDLQKDRSEFHEDKLFDDIKDMMDGYFRVKNDDVQFRSKARKERSFAIPLHRASSSARGLSDLYFFLRHVARKDHLLIIDEPESHLDTANQIQLARLLARCVRAGLKVLITTHSDYLIKEINNLIMLSQSFESKNKIVKKLKYKKNDFLPADSVRAYVAENNTLTPCTIDEFGIDMPVFDKTINDINRVSNELATRVAREGAE